MNIKMDALDNEKLKNVLLLEENAGLKAQVAKLSLVNAKNDLQNFLVIKHKIDLGKYNMAIDPSTGSISLTEREPSGPTGV